MLLLKTLPWPKQPRNQYIRKMTFLTKYHVKLWRNYQLEMDHLLPGVDLMAAMAVVVAVVVEWLRLGVVLIWRHLEEWLDAVVEDLATMEEVPVAVVVAAEGVVVVKDVVDKTRALPLRLLLHKQYKLM